MLWQLNPICIIIATFLKINFNISLPFACTFYIDFLWTGLKQQHHHSSDQYAGIISLAQLMLPKPMFRDTVCNDCMWTSKTIIAVVQIGCHNYFNIYPSSFWRKSHQFPCNLVPYGLHNDTLFHQGALCILWHVNALPGNGSMNRTAGLCNPFVGNG
jgi:hypothetical protein